MKGVSKLRIAEITDEKIVLEMSRVEFRGLDTVVATAGLAWGTLDKTSYGLTEAMLDQTVGSFNMLVEDVEKYRVSKIRK